jgi:hypothetical protein
MGIFSSKHQGVNATTAAAVTANESQNNDYDKNIYAEGGNWTSKRNNMYEYDHNVGSRLIKLAQSNKKPSYRDTDEYDVEEELGLRGGYGNPVNFPDFTEEDMLDEPADAYPKRYLKYQKDILHLLKGGNINMDDYIKDSELARIGNIYSTEGCGCADGKIIYGGNMHGISQESLWGDILDEGCGCADGKIVYGMQGGKSKKDKNQDYDKFASLIQGGGKKGRRVTTSIDLSSTASSSSAQYANNINSSSSFGYKTSSSARKNKDMNYMPFYSTVDSSTSAIGGAGVGINPTVHSATSTMLSNTSSAGSSLKGFKTSTTSDNYMPRPKKSNRY